jgi:membrane protein implicated in regulation of membrane protease activity
VKFSLSGQGKDLNFVRQGAPGRLSVFIARKSRAGFVIWALIIAGGVYMLRLSGHHRALIVLAVILSAGFIRLFLPLFVDRVLRIGAFAILLVLLLWLAQWWFPKLPELRRRWADGRNKALEKRRQKKAEKEQKDAPDEGQDSKSKQDQE